MRVDVNAFVGSYPFRRIPIANRETLLEAMDRTGIDQAWVSDLSAIFWRDPMDANEQLYQLVEGTPRLRPVPAIHPELPGWEEVLQAAAQRDAACVRCDPYYYGIDPVGSPMQALLASCAQQRVPLLMAVRLEDGRQRHPQDRAAEVAPWVIRALVRMQPQVRLIITHADRETVEHVHFGSTPSEASRILWDISWIWGPPEDHLALLLRTVGSERFTFGTGMPLRLPEASVAKLDLLDLGTEERGAIESRNLLSFIDG
jgi:uncharacterized protein